MEIEDNEYDRISHHIASISKEMHELKKVIIEKEKVQEKASKKAEKRLASLRKAQKRFKNISTNLSEEEYVLLDSKLKELGVNKSAYLKQLILKDLQKKE